MARQGTCEDGCNKDPVRSGRVGQDAKARLWGPAIAAVTGGIGLCVSFAGLFLSYQLSTWLIYADVSDTGSVDTAPEVRTIALVALGGLVLGVWLYSLLLRALGERRPKSAAVLVTFVGLLAALLQSEIGTWLEEFSAVFNVAVFVVGAPCLVFLVVRWRLTGRRLRRRLPVALLGYVMLMVVLVFASVQLEQALDRAHARDEVAGLDLGVLDRQGWSADSADYMGDGGIRIVYRRPGADGTLEVATHPPGYSLIERYCGAGRSDCERRGDLLVPTRTSRGSRILGSEGEETPTVFLESGKDVVVVRWNGGSPGPGPGEVDVAAVARDVRTGGGDHEWVADLLAERY